MPDTAESFDIPEVSDLDMAFGGADKHLPPWDALPPEFQRGSNHWCRVANALFFEGGALADHGLKFKDNVDARKALRLTQALLGSFGPKHEHKAGGVGYLLSQWCEPLDPA